MDTKSIRKIMLKNEENLSQYASKDSDAIRLKPIEDDMRPNYFRDTDRIIHSLSYTRYLDKTQVFTHWHNDNVSRRIIHVQLVAKIARTIGRALSLNEDLIEAIALGHDIGHVPFGHPGEAILNEISLKYTKEHFAHNVESVRELMVLENNGKGTNVSVQVLDGILCHNGEFVLGEYHPVHKTKEDFLRDYELCYKDINHIKSLCPMTLEGCVVRISDMIAYLGRDIEDAIRIGVLDPFSIPKEITSVLGKNNREIVNTIILDIIENSIDKPYIKLSDQVFNAMVALKKFNYQNIYYKANTPEKLKYYEQVFNELFVYYRDNIGDERCSINTVFLNSMDTDYLNNTSIERKVIDYLAGMTDDFILKEYDLIKTKVVKRTRGFEIVSAYKDKDIHLPIRKTKNSAAYDIEAAEDIIIPPYKFGDKPTLIPTGLKAYCQEDEYYIVVSRSSGPKKGLMMSNGIGIIDSDYYNNSSNEGHLFFQYYNFSEHELLIKKGEPIGQVIFQKFLKVDNDYAKGERKGGFGSTDK